MNDDYKCILEKQMATCTQYTTVALAHYGQAFSCDRLLIMPHAEYIRCTRIGKFIYAHMAEHIDRVIDERNNNNVTNIIR